MNEQSAKNKLAWEHRAYEFWNRRDGSPEDKAKQILDNPKAQLKNISIISNRLKEKRLLIFVVQMEEKQSH